MVSSKAFTLIEMLVVMAIIALLASMILAAVTMIGKSSERTRTETILTTISQGLHLTLAERGTLPDAAEHPWAGSRAPRPAFARASTGTAVATSGEALRGVALSQLAATGTASRLLLPSDIHNDRACPLLFGLERGRIGLLAAPRADITTYRWLAVPEGMTQVPDRNSDGNYTNTDFADSVHLMQPSTTAADSTAHLSFFLGATTLDELGKLDAIVSSPDTGGRICNDRLWSRQAGAASSEPWAPGRVYDASAGEQGWKDAALPGQALYDAWGREILYSLANGQVRLLSAGADGVFAVDPGLDLVYDPATDPVTGTFAGDDRDGRRDNLGLGQ
ncbi:MAG: type II secretion system protein [Planctomycetota bacterium]|jgi:prepilin-type N-terminal cleavage/methylation domain-containing protein|nr:type II secretion system protein [Planctomycetota bacterium]